MRYLLLIVACSVMGLAVEPEVVPGYREAEKAHDAEIKALNNAWYERKKAYVRSILPLFTKVSVPVLGEDPRPSEVQAQQAARARNHINQDMDPATSNRSSLEAIIQMCQGYPSSMPKLPPFGPTKQDKAEVKEAEKPKEKKKITAVLADGTKIE